MLLNKDRLIISVDPGYDRLGVAILQKENGKEKVLYSDCFVSSKDLSFEQRILDITKKFETLIKKYKPSVLCMEELFMYNNQKTVIKVAESKGVIRYVASKHGLEVFEMTPQEIKLAVAGSGTAKKEEVARMVQLITKHKTTTSLDDEYDAIACGLAGLAYLKTI